MAGSLPRVAQGLADEKLVQAIDDVVDPDRAWQPVMRFSIIVPVLNEAGAMSALAAQLRPLMREGAEVLLVDGGSTDDTCALAVRAGLQVLHSACGRATQMNAGAARTTGDVLLFLHADTQLPPRALEQVQSSLQPPYCWGRFDVRISGQSRMLGVVAFMMNWRSRLTGMATGDQAIFMTRQAFESIGGMPEQPLMEDIEVSRRLRELASPACLRCKVTTSGRRWDSRGVWRTIFLMWRLRWAYWRGTPASQLAEAYR